MKLKSFFADTIEEAIRLARRELGPDAMLVNSKRAGVEARHLGCYEVVVCGEAREAGSTAASSNSDPCGRPCHRLPLYKWTNYRRMFPNSSSAWRSSR